MRWAVYKFDKGVPIATPTKFPRLARSLAEMDVGDSFFVQKAKWTDGMRCAAYRYARKLKIRIVSRQVAGGMRVWRVAYKPHFSETVTPGGNHHV